MHPCLLIKWERGSVAHTIAGQRRLSMSEIKLSSQGQMINAWLCCRLIQTKWQISACLKVWVDYISSTIYTLLLPKGSVPSTAFYLHTHTLPSITIHLLWALPLHELCYLAHLFVSLFNSLSWQEDEKIMGVVGEWGWWGK